jgi:hypothetical protein
LALGKLHALVELVCMLVLLVCVLPCALKWANLERSTAGKPPALKMLMRMRVLLLRVLAEACAKNADAHACVCVWARACVLDSLQAEHACC